MKQILYILLVLALAQPLHLAANAQTGEATIVITPSGSDVDVSLYLTRTGGTAWKLGISSFVFDFNNSALTFSSLIANGVWSGGNYGLSFTAAYGTTARSMEIEFNGSAGQGTDVPTVATLVGTLRFTFTNPTHGITWNVLSSFISNDAGTDVTSGITFTNPSGGSLPITLSSFTATIVSQGRVRLDWTTISETNNYGFEVQKSFENQNSYQLIPNSFIPGNGTTNEPHSYSFIDNTASGGRWFYRLKQIDLDGTTHFTDGIQVDVLTSVTEKPLPKEFALDQNYPNPFNPSTRIEYAVPRESHVRLVVYNLLGQQVATLVDAVKSAGYYTASFGAAEFPSGLYFYKMNAGNISFLKKMMLVK